MPKTFLTHLTDILLADTKQGWVRNLIMDFGNHISFPLTVLPGVIAYV